MPTQVETTFYATGQKIDYLVNHMKKYSARRKVNK
jgi:hypothetical protein